jgi:hypothetical protein
MVIFSLNSKPLKSTLKMKIQLLFDELEKIKETSKLDFKNSGMVNRFNEMKYGFFPIGWGILDENNRTDKFPPTVDIEEGGIMVLGNDFGTLSYVTKVKNYSNGIGEIRSSTILNMSKRGLAINTKDTFFTNFYLGIRLDDGLYRGTTMTKRMYKDKPNQIKKEYWDLCYKFFNKQLELFKPRIVICLGHEVKNALIGSAEAFNKWKPNATSIEKLYLNGDFVVEKELNKPTFVVITHPCYLGNFKAGYVEKLNIILKSNEV